MPALDARFHPRDEVVKLMLIYSKIQLAAVV